MSEIVARSLNHNWQENADGTVTVTTSQDVQKYLESAKAIRDADEALGQQLTRDEGMHHVGTIPPVIVQKWRDEGFDLLSPERSRMTPEEHQKELLRRLCGEYAFFNTSRFGRLT